MTLVVKLEIATEQITRFWVQPCKGQIKPKSRLAHRRFSQKQTDEFDLFAVKSKKANKTNPSVHILGEVSRPSIAFEIN